MKYKYSDKSRKNIPIKNPNWHLIGYYHLNGYSTAFEGQHEARQYIMEIMHNHYYKPNGHRTLQNNPALFYIGFVYTIGRKSPKKAAKIFVYTIDCGDQLNQAVSGSSSDFKNLNKTKKRNASPFMIKILDEEAVIREKISSRGGKLSADLKKYYSYWSKNIPDYTTHDRA